MRYPQDSIRWFPLGILLFLSGCAVVPQYEYSEKALLAEQEAPWEFSQQSDLAVTSLLELVDVPELHILVQRGLEVNPSLRQTALTLKSSQASIALARADRLPGLNASFSNEKVKDNDITYSGQLTVGWTVDVWGKLDDAIKAAEADEIAAQAEYTAAKDLLVSTILDTWLSLVQQQRLITIQKKRLDVLESNEAVILERYRKGLDELADLDTARTASESARANLASMQETRLALRRTLRVLVGGDKVADMFPTQFPDVITPLTGYGAQDLARRPDLQQAYREIVAAEYEARVAYKALLPSLSLDLALSGSGEKISDALFASPVWSLLGQLTQPLFDGGRLRAEAEIADFGAEQKYWAYRETLLNAVTEVENALSQEKSLKAQQEYIQRALESAERSNRLYTRKYRQGLSTFLELLQIQEATFDLESQLTQLTYQRLSNRITLGLALGLGVSS
ncbi:MAG: TolC family protein [Candidatus Thiodiazotropha sp.]|jgi:NodT family efflux transporter outer membrane factor (OMF) lipoprotein